MSHRRLQMSQVSSREVTYFNQQQALADVETLSEAGLSVEPQRFCAVCDEPISSGRYCATHARRSGYDWRQEQNDEAERNGL